MFKITEQPIDTEALLDRLDDPAAGAVAVFDGRVRNHHEGHAVHSLEYEAYVTLAESEGRKILDEALEQFEILHAIAEHRVGHLGIGEVAVWVGISAAHRDAAFAAGRYVIDEVKHRVAIWKKEHYVDGSSEWVGCAACAHTPAAHAG